MKKEFHLVLMSLLVMAVAPLAFGQDALAPPNVGQTNYRAELGDIAAPNSPALILLGEEPSLINRVTTPKKFVITADNLLSNGALAYPAIEFCPFYWFADGRAAEYGKHDFDGDFARALESMSLSMAVANTNATGSPVRTVAFGLRTTLYSEGINPEFDQEAKNFKTLQTQDVQGNDRAGESSGYKAYRAFEDKWNELQNDDAFAVGPFIQLAGGLGVDSPELIGSNGAVAHTWGYWLTLADRVYGNEPSKSPASFVEAALLLGYTGDKYDLVADSFEAGGRLTVQIVPEVALSGEGVIRGSDNMTHTDLECAMRMDKEVFLDVDYFTPGFQNANGPYSLTASLKIEKSLMTLFD